MRESDSAVHEEEEEALRWVARLTSGAATDADQHSLMLWRAQSDTHERAFQDALKLWHQVGHSAVAHPPGLLRAPAASSRRWFLKAGALAAGVGGIAFAGAKLGFWPDLSALTADYSTAAGEQRRLALRDNVEIDLNTRSALSMSDRNAPSDVTLTAGEALFTVRSGAGRFVVSAAETLVASEGGAFVIRSDDGRLRITCLDGAARLLQPTSLRLQPLEQVICDGRTIGAVRRVDDSDRVAGWRRGVLEFRGEAVESVVAELNRYRKGLIVVASRAVARRRVTGIFHLDRLDEALDHIHQTLKVPVRHFSPYLVVLG